MAGINPIEIVSAIAGALLLCLAIYVGISAKSVQGSVSFVAVMLSCIFWIFVNAAIQSANERTILFWVRLAHLAVLPVAYTLLNFALTYPRQIDRRRKILFYAILPAVTAAAVTFQPNFILTASLVTDNYTFSYGNLFPLYIALVGILILAFCSVTYLQYKQASSDKLQVLYVATGVILSTLFAFCTDLLLPLFGQKALADMGPTGTVFLAFFSAYSILYFHMFDIKVLIRRTVVYSILLATIFSTYTLLIFLFTQLFNVGQAQTSSETLLNFIVTLIVGFSFDPLRRWLQDRTDKFLYKKEYEQQSVLKDLSTQLNTVIGLDEALETVMQTIVKTLKVVHAVTYVFQPGEQGSLQIKRIKQIGYPVTKNLILQERDFVVDYFCIFPQITTLKQLDSELAHESHQLKQMERSSRRGVDISEQTKLLRSHAKKQAVAKKLRALESEVVVPLHLGQQFIGLLLLSGKLNQDAFTHNDLQLLELAGEVTISSIEKAKLYEGDQMKSEFVSIASHELLTPISAIEGYLSMILDEHIGKVDPQARDYLTKVYISSRRLSQLVKDLLSVSRIESGKMKMDAQAVDMQKMIHDTLDQLRFLAQNKGLELNYQASAKTLPLVNADPDRVMQILVNLVSNAIKYTPTGSVSISAARGKGGLTIDVKDTGMGISREQRSHLFEKFYRIDSPETVGIIGTGLGLYITKSILERMGGTIRVESIPKRGSTFSITLPLFEAEASPLA